MPFPMNNIIIETTLGNLKALYQALPQGAHSKKCNPVLNHLFIDAESFFACDGRIAIEIAHHTEGIPADFKPVSIKSETIKNIIKLMRGKNDAKISFDIQGEKIEVSPVALIAQDEDRRIPQYESAFPMLDEGEKPIDSIATLAWDYYKRATVAYGERHGGNCIDGVALMQKKVKSLDHDDEDATRKYQKHVATFLYEEGFKMVVMPLRF